MDFAERLTRLLKNKIFRRSARGSAGFLSLRAVGQVVGVWKGLDQRPKYVNFADIVYQSEQSPLYIHFGFGP